MSHHFYSLLLAASLSLPVSAAVINFPADTKIDASARSLQAVKLGEQSVAVNQQTDKLLYHDLTATVFTADAATLQAPVLQWTGTWMHGYLYIDLNGDGELAPNELVSASYCQGKNSLGATAKQDCGVTLPKFGLPELKAGDYLMRYIVDWDSNDPAGSDRDGNTIVKNNGAIVDVTLRVNAAAQADEPYKLNYPADKTIDASVRHLNAVNVNSPLLGNARLEVPQAQTSALYFDMTETKVDAMAGEPLEVAVDWTGDWMNTYVYIDRGGNGDFCVIADESGKVMPGSDLLSYSNLNGSNSAGGNGGNNIAAPQFVLPADIVPGQYRMRVKVDWNSADPAGNTTADNNIVKNRGAIVDLTLNVINAAEGIVLYPKVMNGIMLDGNGAPLTGIVAKGYERQVIFRPTLPGYVCDKAVVRSAKGDVEIAISADGIAVIPAEATADGDIEVYAIFTETEDSEWTKVWGDEFNSGEMDTKRWSYHPRRNATWSRYIAVTKQGRGAVNHFDGGVYTANCVISPAELAGDSDDTEREYMSGAIYSQGKLDITYGKIEARILTSPHTGNFPAFWMMPSESLDGGWPNSGEIDIWEQINASNGAHSTVHSGWTGWKNYNKWEVGPKQGSPKSTNEAWVDASLWHVYALEWDAEELRWYVDGEQTFSYKNMHYSEEGTNYTEKICWPFYKDFYIILNQSVGQAGGWASAPDPAFTYTTKFDYVRVYKRKDCTGGYSSSITHNGDDPEFFVPAGTGEEPTPPETTVSEVSAPGEAVYYDLNGRRIASPSAGLLIKADSNGAYITRK